MNKLWTALAILVGLACGVMAVKIVLRPPMKPGEGPGMGRPRVNVEEQLDDMEKFDPKLVIGKEAARYATGIAKLTGLAVGPDDRIYAVGDKTLVVLTSEGKPSSRVDLGGAPTCVAVGPDSTVYIGMMEHVEVLDPQGARKASWPTLGSTGWITSIAASESEVYVANFGERRVVKYDNGGKILSHIGPEGLDKGLYELPSPYFDVALDPQGSPWIVETGKHVISNVRSDGSVATAWGHYGPKGEIHGFCGCCNPTHIAIRHDGSFVTSEKGAVRVKIHSPSGELVGVVARSTDFKKDIHGLDLAVDSKDRILVLDPETGTIRVFVVKI